MTFNSTNNFTNTITTNKPCRQKKGNEFSELYNRFVRSEVSFTRTEEYDHKEE